MDNEFVTYEQALALKELGFNEMCLGYFDSKSELAFNTNGNPISKDWVWFGNQCLPVDMTLAPLKQQVFRWFRENHDWIGGVRMLSGGSNYLVGEFYKDEDNSFMRFRGTYEEIENDCINELIDRVKEQNNG
jgi:hypothetical protein